MSLTAQGDERSAAGAGAGAGAAALGVAPPKLRTGGYAAWRQDMAVHLARIGAAGAHLRQLSTEDWLKLVAQTHAWDEQATTEALAAIGIGAAAGAAAA